MAEMVGPNIAADLRRIHMIVTRGLDVSISNAAGFKQEGLPQGELGEGFRSYLTALLSFLTAHHLSEDEVAFPYFQERMPDLPIAQLEEEHKRMQDLLDRAQKDLQGLDDGSGQALDDLEGALRQIRDLWGPHITVEEEHLGVQRLAEMLPPEEHARLGGLLGQHSMQHAKPDYLILPFALYNLPPEQRAIFSQTLPPMVTQQLVPLVWKEKWAPMQSFLLE
jgi:hypothetical protein